MTILGVAAVVLGLPGAMTAAHLTLISIASLFYRDQGGRDSAPVTFLVVVPAHNEELVIGAMLDSLIEQARDRDLTLVVADRCVDSTAEMAREKGVEVLERPDSSRPGRAAAVADGIGHMADRAWDAVVLVDADSYLEPGFFEGIEVRLGTGSRAVQPRSEHVRAPGVLARLSEIAFAMQGVTLPRGRSRLGLSVRLRGSGMTMSRELALTREFGTEGASEDLFYSLQLLLDGHTAIHADNARLRSLSAPNLVEGSKQRLRWETGRIAAARRFAPRLLTRGTWPAFEAGIFLVTPPLSIAILLLLMATALSWWAAWTAGAIVFGAAILLLALDVVIALIESEASWRTWLALLAAPPYLLWKGGIQVAAFFNIRNAGTAYRPTQRDR
jgi:cellulose synthase/poly-beta-1,6-N-acetylglucosamine synthase-like glycosyltransferase